MRPLRVFRMPRQAIRKALEAKPREGKNAIKQWVGADHLYTAAEPALNASGLAILAFRDDTPYQGEDLIYDAEGPSFLARCTRDRAGPTPGTCLYERRIGAADVVVRFPREWLGDWRMVAGTLDRLIASVRPPR